MTCESFCAASRNAVALILRNASRFMGVLGLGEVVNKGAGIF